ncbi:hypothetical protein Pelo_14819 [Pelomyxa schiedti]|nr:hypothetical protein Pelo_14819 [Pelomyxa schiedti]
MLGAWVPTQPIMVEWGYDTKGGIYLGDRLSTQQWQALPTCHLIHWRVGNSRLQRVTSIGIFTVPSLVIPGACQHVSGTREGYGGEQEQGVHLGDRL